jgi:hypothetical protein
MESRLRGKTNTTMNRKETNILVARSGDGCLTFDMRLICYFVTVFFNIILLMADFIVSASYKG